MVGFSLKEHGLDLVIKIQNQVGYRGFTAYVSGKRNRSTTKIVKIRNDVTYSVHLHPR
jgi:hypothetical protein